ncbi:alpha/beta fold hydrolase [Streptomyces sp. NPDC046727]|uniref:alpha/beta hydrolase family protein n=1 Tax=Streptomyces sp. NPDC046727 TaxID=3155373 RepID=UPI0033E8F470
MPSGSVLDAAPRAGGAVDDLWSDSAHPPVPHTRDGITREDSAPEGIALPPPGPRTVVPGRHTDLWTPTDSGRVHTLLSLPEPTGSSTPPPAVFLVHGGPADHDRDAYDATVHSLVASGYAVVRVNYRGSTRCGPRWRHAFPSGVGHTQVDDLAAVRAELVARGLVDGAASTLWGVSWGAYLVLLALGTRPGLWQAGIAVKPVADWAAAHGATTSALRALDVRLFGGTPDEGPERYAASSPLTYAATATAPLLVVGATRDTKCPLGQIRTYLAALAAADVPHEAIRLDTGHDGYDGAAHVAVLRRALRFLRDQLPDPALRAPYVPRHPREDPGLAEDTAGPGVHSTIPLTEGGTPCRRTSSTTTRSRATRRTASRTSASPSPSRSATRTRAVTTRSEPRPGRAPRFLPPVFHAVPQGADRARSPAQHALVAHRPALPGPGHPQTQCRRARRGRDLRGTARQPGVHRLDHPAHRVLR